MERKRVSMQIRLPQNLHEEIKQEAEELGVPLNSHLIELLWIGIKARKNFPIIQSKKL